MAGMRETLNELIRLDGVRTAVIVGRDGFVIEGVTSDSSIEVESVGAVISTGLAHADLMGRDLAVGGLTQGMAEYEKGITVMTSLGEYALLCLVCDTGVNLGMVRMRIRQRSPELIDMI